MQPSAIVDKTCNTRILDLSFYFALQFAPATKVLLLYWGKTSLHVRFTPREIWFYTFTLARRVCAIYCIRKNGYKAKSCIKLIQLWTRLTDQIAFGCVNRVRRGKQDRTPPTSVIWCFFHYPYLWQFAIDKHRMLKILLNLQSWQSLHSTCNMCSVAWICTVNPQTLALTIFAKSHDLQTDNRVAFCVLHLGVG